MGQTLLRSNAHQPAVDTGVHSPATDKGLPMRLDKRRAWIVGVMVAAAALVGGTFVITALVDGPATTAIGRISQTSTTSPPKPISRVELMEEYAKIAPDDATATPDTMDDIAGQVCDKLARGHSTDELITALTDMYRTNSTKVVRLLVSYGCPEYLADFK